MARSQAVRLRYYELEQFKRSVRLFLWGALGICAVVAVLALGIALVALAKPIPVVAFDAEGRPIVFEDTMSPRLKLEQVRIEAFAEDFLGHWVGIDSSNLDRDMAGALNMMTPRLREIALHDEAQLQRRLDYDGANVRSRFVELRMKVSPYDAEDGSVRIYLIAWGELLYTPREGVVQDGQELSQHFFSQVAMQRIAITREHPHGLMVDYVNTKFFKDADELRRFSIKREP